jgi:hypothetical protein
VGLKLVFPVVSRVMSLLRLSRRESWWKDADDEQNWRFCTAQRMNYRPLSTARNRRYAPNDGGLAQRSPVTFCDDHRTVFATANGRIHLTAGILAAAQVVLASLRAPHLDRGCGPAAIATAQETVDKEHCR